MDTPKLNLFSCPVCDRQFEESKIENHVNKCLFLNTEAKSNSKRSGLHLDTNFSNEKRVKLDNLTTITPTFSKETDTQESQLVKKETSMKQFDQKGIPLAERMRPKCLGDIVGQKDSFGPGSMLYSMLQRQKIPNMILWGPPGCGKTSLANIVANICKDNQYLRFVKLSATMSGINDVKEAVKVAKNEAQFKRQTVLFMDEIHRFNKLQQDTFLPHVENGTIILIGATTENLSFSLNNALLSRCRVVVMGKLTVDDVMQILERAIVKNKLAVIVDDAKDITCDLQNDSPRCLLERSSIQWLAEVCDGDARVALGALELTITARTPEDCKDSPVTSRSNVISLEDLKNGIKRSHMLYDRRGEEHYNIISAIHKSIRASDDNAALYWTTRALHGGEDPLFIARRLIRIACEDVGLADQNAIVDAVACLQGCQHVGMPECDVLLAQCAVRLARASKSREVYDAMKRCQRSLKEAKGPLPSVPLHLRNAPTKLMSDLGYGNGYNLLHKDESRLTYMPEGLERINYFREDSVG